MKRPEKCPFIFHTLFLIRSEFSLSCGDKTQENISSIFQKKIIGCLIKLNPTVIINIPMVYKVLTYIWNY